MLARAPAAQLEDIVAGFGQLPDFAWLRQPEIGGVMVRGRLGGAGSAFNLGEMTVTRCTLRLTSGEVGHAYVQGRDKAHAERAALVDAMMQSSDAGAVQSKILDPLATRMAETRTARAAKAAATKVEFFTMVRGEN